MKMLKTLTVAITLTAVGSMAAKAAPVIWDYSPDATGSTGSIDTFVNSSTGQNFLERIDFAADTEISAMDIFSANGVAVGTSATIKVFSAVGGNPGTLLTSFTDTISIVDTDGTTIRAGVTRKYVEFTSALNLAAGTYFIGMSGTSSNIGLSGLRTPVFPDDGGMWQLNNNSISFFASSIGDSAFRLYGAGDPVPAPGALLLLGLGLIGLGLKRKAA